MRDYRFSRNTGIDFASGFLLARPLPMRRLLHVVASILLAFLFSTLANAAPPTVCMGGDDELESACSSWINSLSSTC